MLVKSSIYDTCENPCLKELRLNIQSYQAPPCMDTISVAKSRFRYHKRKDGALERADEVTIPIHRLNPKKSSRKCREIHSKQASRMSFFFNTSTSPLAVLKLIQLCRVVKVFDQIRDVVVIVLFCWLAWTLLLDGLV